MNRRHNQSRRGHIGYQYGKMTNNNIRQVPKARNTYNVLVDTFGNVKHEEDEMEGGTFFDNVKHVLKTGTSAANSAKDVAGKLASATKAAHAIATSETATALRNLLPSSDENARNGYPGELHAILKLPNGKNGVANYMGRLGSNRGSKALVSRL